MSNNVPFSKGVNFSKWFETRNVESIRFENFNEQDFADVKSMGADVVRVPIAMHNYTGGSPDYTLSPVLLKYLDAAVDWAEKHELYIIIDNHSFHPINPTDVNIDKILLPVWNQIASRYKDRSKFVIYEVLNEPHHIEDDRWGEIQGLAIDAIRKIDKTHTIIVGGTDYNSIEKLFAIPKYKDNNLIYTFHFYDPHIFTHQGATWGNPSLASLAGLPFPEDKSRKPTLPADLKGTWVEKALEDYEEASSLKVLLAPLDKVHAFSKERGVPVFCGEFGVYMIQSPPADRIKWYELICAELNKRSISWTSWDYFGGFGIFKTDRKGDFKTHANGEVLRAMGFKY